MSEADRLKALTEYQILDSFPEKEFDEIVELASALYETPISFISLIEADRQWFKSIKGLEAAEADRKYAFCNYTIQQEDVMIVEDTTQDDRFYQNPYVIDDPKIRFYAGVPLITPDKQAIGTICVIDDKPRTLEEEQKKPLGILAKRVMNLLELRKENLNQKAKLSRTKEELQLTLNRLIQAQQNARIGSWDWDVKTNELYWSQEMYRIFGLQPEEVNDLLNEWQSLVHKRDIQLVRNTLIQGFKEKRQDVIRYRVNRPDGAEVWVETSGGVEIDEKGEVSRMSGTVQDISERMQADERRLLYANTLQELMYDLSHKIRQPLTNCMSLVNIFNENKQTETKMKEYANYLSVSVKKIDEYTRELSEIIYKNQEVIRN